jgi:hypothetical protein
MRAEAMTRPANLTPSGLGGVRYALPPAANFVY